MQKIVDSIRSSLHFWMPHMMFTCFTFSSQTFTCWVYMFLKKSLRYYVKIWVRNYVKQDGLLKRKTFNTRIQHVFLNFLNTCVYIFWIFEKPNLLLGILVFFIQLYIFTTFTHKNIVSSRLHFSIFEHAENRLRATQINAPTRARTADLQLIRLTR